MKDFLETLELGESKTKLSKEEIKSILAEHGKGVKVETEKVEDTMKKENVELKTTIDDLKKQVETLPKSDEVESMKTKIADYEKKEADRIFKEQETTKENALMTNINEVIADKKFINEFTKNAIVNELKATLKDEANIGKSAKDLFDTITKDKTDIFSNPNQVQDMAGVGDSEENKNAKEIPLIW